MAVGHVVRPVAAVSAPWWDPTGEHWGDVVDWWRSPALAYLKGLRDGAQLERERQARIDEQAHREAVRKALRVVEVGAARERADRRRST